MRHTVKIGGPVSLDVIQDGGELTVEVRTMGLVIHRQVITPEVATMASTAFGYAAMDAQKARQAQAAEAARG